MMLQLMAALSAGGFVFLMIAWFVGVGAVAPVSMDRVRGLRTATAGPTGPTALESLRARAGTIRMGGVNVVNADIVRRWELELERAGLTLKVREYFILRVLIGLFIGMVAFLFFPMRQFVILAAPAGFAFGFYLVGMWVRRKRAARVRKLESQLIELLQMLSSGLRAGFGLLQAMEAAGQQLPAPIQIEVRRAMRDTAMGSSVESALQAMNERVGSSDWDIVITAIMIQRTVGGNLAEILDNVAHTMRERERIKGEIRTLTSQQRLTGYVIGCIPFGLGAFFSLVNWEFMGLMFTTTLGNMMLGAGFVMWFIGFMIIRKIVNIEV